CRTCIIAVTLFCGDARFARGGLITHVMVDITTQPNGEYDYLYTIADDAASTLPVVEFTLTVDPTASLESVSGPSEWLITYNTGGPLVDWSSPSSAAGIQPGGSATFEFISSLPPLTQAYLVLGVDDVNFIIDTNTGMIASPGVSSVPEPSAITLGCVGAL